MNGPRNTDYESFEARSREHRQLLRQEELMLEITEALSEALQHEDISKAELGRRLGKSRGFVSQIFSGGRNLTLRTLATVADALGYRVEMRLRKGAVISFPRAKGRQGETVLVPQFPKPAEVLKGWNPEELQGGGFRAKGFRVAREQRDYLQTGLKLAS